MTLVVARAFHEGVRIYADWRITYPDSHPSSVRQPSFLTGMPKIWILRPDLAVAFANEVKHALPILDDVMAHPIDQESVIQKLVDGTRRYPDVAFIVATLAPVSLMAVSDGVALPRENAWIGDVNAYDEYRRKLMQSVKEAREFSGQIPTDYITVTSMMESAFHEVVKEEKSPWVGELALHVVPGERGFIYAPKAEMYGNSVPTSIPGDNQWRTISHGTVEGGAFGYTLLGGVNVPAVGLYFPHAKLGSLFFPARLNEPAVYRSVSMESFIAAVDQEIGVELRPGVGIN